MTIEPEPPKFTPPAAKIWNAISPDDQQTLVSKAWCSKCRQEVTVSDYSGSVKAGHVFLNGVCSQCGGAAYRFIEVTRYKDKTFTVVLGKSKLTSADAISHSKLTTKDFNAYMRRRRLLERKSYEGTITKSERKELDKNPSKTMNGHLKAMMSAVLQLSSTIDR
jgi:hypothetical protein